MYLCVSEQRKNMIRNIVFDMGGVLYRFEPDLPYREYPGEDGKILYNAIFGSPDWRRQDLGEISEDEMISLASARVPERLHLAVERLVHWYELTGPVPRMAELVQELSEKGYALYLLSNVGFAFHNFRGLIPAICYFKGEFISAEHGLLKPDPEIFRKFMTTFDLRAEECLFIDDMASNIEGAHSVGMEGIVFENADQLRDKLEDIGIL